MNKLVTSAAFAAAGACLFAATEQKELMTVEFNDGTEAVVYEVDNVSKITLSVEEVATPDFTVTPAEGEPFEADVVSHLFRVNGTNGARTQCALGYAPDATDLAGLKASKYVVVFEVSNIGTFTLPGDASAKLYEYADGEFVGEIDAVTDGTLSYSVNSKNGNVTVEFDATFEGGIHAVAVYSGSATDVESLSDLLPAVEVKNELSYYDADGNLSYTYPITGVVKAENPKINGVNTSFVQYKFQLDGDSNQCYIAFDPKYNGVTVDFAMMTTADFIVYYQTQGINLSGPNNSFWIGQGTDGSFTVTENEDGTLNAEASYSSMGIMWGSQSGKPDRVVIHYNGPVEAE